MPGDNKRSYVLKVGLSPSKTICFICFDESLLKLVKNAFYFNWKAFSVLKMFQFLCWLLSSYRKNNLIRNVRLISIFWRHRLCNKELQYTFSNISRSKGNQKMKFSQLIKYNVTNIFLRKSCRKLGSETSSRPIFLFLKIFVWGKSKWPAS